MARKGLLVQSLEASMAGALRFRRIAWGGLLHGAAARRAASTFAPVPGDAPRHVVDGLERHLGAVLVATGLVAMAVGILVYLTDRDPSHAALIPAIAALTGSSLFGVLGQWMPSFVHPFAFSLFTVATYPSRTSAGYRVCVAWWAVNVAFEVAQYPGINRAVAEAIEGVFGQSWPSRLLSNYVLRGAFDVGDLIAATAGAIAAATVLCLARRMEAKHEQWQLSRLVLETNGDASGDCHRRHHHHCR